MEQLLANSNSVLLNNPRQTELIMIPNSTNSYDVEVADNTVECMNVSSGYVYLATFSNVRGVARNVDILRNRVLLDCTPTDEFGLPGSTYALLHINGTAIAELTVRENVVNVYCRRRGSLAIGVRAWTLQNISNARIERNTFQLEAAQVTGVEITDMAAEMNKGVPVLMNLTIVNNKLILTSPTSERIRGIRLASPSVPASFIPGTFRRFGVVNISANNISAYHTRTIEPTSRDTVVDRQELLVVSGSYHIREILVLSNTLIARSSNYSRSTFLLPVRVCTVAIARVQYNILNAVDTDITSPTIPVSMSPLKFRTGLFGNSVSAAMALSFETEYAYFSSASPLVDVVDNVITLQGGSRATYGFQVQIGPDFQETGNPLTSIVACDYTGATKSAFTAFPVTFRRNNVSIGVRTPLVTSEAVLGIALQTLVMSDRSTTPRRARPELTISNNRWALTAGDAAIPNALLYAAKPPQVLGAVCAANSLDAPLLTARDESWQLTVVTREGDSTANRSAIAFNTQAAAGFLGLLAGSLNMSSSNVTVTSPGLAILAKVPGMGTEKPPSLPVDAFTAMRLTLGSTSRGVWIRDSRITLSNPSPLSASALAYGILLSPQGAAEGVVAMYAMAVRRSTFTVTNMANFAVLDVNDATLATASFQAEDLAINNYPTASPTNGTIFDMRSSSTRTPYEPSGYDAGTVTLGCVLVHGRRMPLSDRVTGDDTVDLDQANVGWISSNPAISGCTWAELASSTASRTLPARLHHRTFSETRSTSVTGITRSGTWSSTVNRDSRRSISSSDARGPFTATQSRTQHQSSSTTITLESTGSATIAAAVNVCDFTGFLVTVTGTSVTDSAYAGVVMRASDVNSNGVTLLVALASRADSRRRQNFASAAARALRVASVTDATGLTPIAVVPSRGVVSQWRTLTARTPPFVAPNGSLVVRVGGGPSTGATGVELAATEYVRISFSAEAFACELGAADAAGSTPPTAFVLQVRASPIKALQEAETQAQVAAGATAAAAVVTGASAAVDAQSLAALSFVRCGSAAGRAASDTMKLLLRLFALEGSGTVDGRGICAG
jgi:hypothetical protein